MFSSQFGRGSFEKPHWDGDHGAGLQVRAGLSAVNSRLNAVEVSTRLGMFVKLRKKVQNGECVSFPDIGSFPVPGL